MKAKNYRRDDGDGRLTRTTLWNHPGNDITGIVSRCEKLVNTVEDLIGGEVYHYHAKVIMKDPNEGAQFPWHQDYGYEIYNNIIVVKIKRIRVSTIIRRQC